MNIKSFLLMSVLLLLGACDKLSYHPYDVDVDDSYRNLNSAACRRIEQMCAASDTLRFVATGDTQGWYDDTRDFVANVNRDARHIDFFVHLGDLSDYGTAQEFVWQHELLKELKVPYVCDLGNHDCLGTGRDTFNAMYGSENFSFIAGRVKFLMINTNSLEYDYHNAVPDLNFIEIEKSARVDEFDRTVVAMHARPYTEVFDNNIAKAFQFYLRQMPGLLFCLNGHGHAPEVVDLFRDGTLYYQTPNIARRQYYLFTITPDGYSYETIDF